MLYVCCMYVVHRDLSNLDNPKSAGSDDIHPQMVRCFADFLAEPLCNLFVNSLTTAVATTDWRLAIICPIHKEGDQEDVSNYRPSLFYNM